MDDYLKFADNIPNGNEQDNKTIDKDGNQDDKLMAITIPNKNGEEEKIEIKDEPPTKYTTKTVKIPYGKFIDYNMPKNEISNPINLFFQVHKDIYYLVYVYFDDKVSHFVSQRVIELKKAFVDFALIIINLLILGDGKNQWQLVGIDYKTFCVNLTKGFIDYYLDKKLDELFIIFQTKNEGELKDNNKKVINYIRSNREKELFANEYLDKNFYELVEEFNKKRLNKYLIEKEGELYNEYVKKGKQIADIEVRIKAYDTLIRTLSINFREYSESIQGRKKKEKKEEIILSPYFDFLKL